MEKSYLWSLRLGFSTKEAQKISEQGISNFIDNAIHAKYDTTLPEFLNDEPKTLKELKRTRKELKEISKEEAKLFNKERVKRNIELRKWLIQKFQDSEYPLREKMALFWQNHYVATFQKVKVNYWVYQHNSIVREHAFGNFKTLTKAILKSNAMVRYLDNTDNKKDKINENLSRELLELFTIGIGNYSEEDIKNGAKALAGLNIGNEHAEYKPNFEDNDEIVYFGKKGHFKADDLVDIIFEQKNIPYLITKKILQWFVYDSPSSELVAYYGDYFRSVDFEIAPLLKKIVVEEYQKDNSGSKIKDPITYLLQLQHELNSDGLDPNLIIYFLKQQDMDLFNQPNVKGWVGGNNWLTSQNYLQRNNIADLLCSGRTLNRKIFNTMGEDNPMKMEQIKVSLQWNKEGNNIQIIKELSDRLLFKVDQNTQEDMEKILKYDFDPKAENANQAVLRLFNYIVTLPEFQII